MAYVSVGENGNGRWELVRYAGQERDVKLWKSRIA